MSFYRRRGKNLMIVGVGVDLVDLREFERRITLTPELLERIFSHEELQLKPSQLAGNFASKEAFAKAYGRNFNPLECSILRNISGAPQFKFQGQLMHELSQQNISVSISNKENLVIAFVLIEMQDS